MRKAFAWKRPHHQVIGSILAGMDAEFLLDAHCYFGGGTQIALALNEFRESRDIDFLCSNREGFRKVRETVTQSSLGKILDRPLTLAREVRADRDGVRTFLSVGDTRIKFEIILEARIDLRGAMDAKFKVPVLDLDCMVAEKFLANADRGIDESTQSRDMIDLAFLAMHYPPSKLLGGLQLAESAYGSAIRRNVSLVLDKFKANRNYASTCAKALSIQDLLTLRKGLQKLRAITAD